MMKFNRVLIYESVSCKTQEISFEIFSKYCRLLKLQTTINTHVNFLGNHEDIWLKKSM